MTPKQQSWLEAVADRIPGLFDAIQTGQIMSATVIGERIINNKNVRLSLSAEVVDSGADPLGSHASVNYPSTPNQVIPEGMAKPKPRYRKSRTRR